MREKERGGKSIQGPLPGTPSHELRTPLTTLLLQAQWLRREKADDPEISHAAEVIERAARTQAQLIDDLLDVSRIAAGKLKLQVEAVDLGAIVQTACDMVRALAEKKSISMEVELDKSVGPVMAIPSVCSRSSGILR